MGGEARKIVTVLFSDISGSTAMGGAMDPESFRRIISRYFEEMKLVLERHGGTVEKFIGDAVMAVFGIPRVHEDDALRAVRAAAEMRTALERLNQELEPTWGVSIVTRTGVNTGEVVAGDPSQGQSFVVGDSVNLAARLEQSALPGTVLIGETTYRLVRDAVVAEEMDPLAVKGKEEPIPAWNVLEVSAITPGWVRRLDSPLVGREAELDTVRRAFDRAVERPGCEEISIMGPAGVGKSRMTNELLARLGGRATAITGRCLPYGEGITFWPIVEVVRDAAGISEQDSAEEARNKLSSLLGSSDDGSAVAKRLAALLGPGEQALSIQETFWAVRRLFETMAERRPLVVMLDDIHWGQPTFLDLLEYLASFIRAAPVFLLCLARPELLDVRQAWMKDRPNAGLIHLHPLTPSETEGLIRNLLAGAELEREARTRITEVAEGNPLFVEETLRMLVDQGALQAVDSQWRAVSDLSRIEIPATIHALLTARLDRLESEERAVIERASIVGRVFWPEALSVLAPDDLRPKVAGHLQSLMRKELVRPDFSDPAMGDAYRFGHILIRDAAYAGITKTVRADLHERLADWIERRTGERAGEYEEIIGYHLEQAHGALVDLVPADERVRAMGRRAAGRLASSGLRAFSRGDMPAAVNLLSRAASLLPQDDPDRLELLPSLAFALMETGDFGRLQAVVAQINEAAQASGDPGLQAHAVVLALWIRLFTDPEGWAEEARREAGRAIETFQSLADQRGLARGWSVLGLVHTMKAQFAAAEQAWERAADYAQRAGDHRDHLESLAWVPLTVWAGPADPIEAGRRLQKILQRAGDDRKAMASALFMRAPFEAGLGRPQEARDLIARARAILEEVELTVWLAGPLAQVAGWVELTAGDAQAAERELRRGYETLGQIGDVAWLSTTVAILAEAVYRQGRYEEAEEFTRTSEQASAPDDVYSQVLWRSVRAKVLARRGESDPAEELARKAVALVDASDFLHLRAGAVMSLAEVLQVLGRPTEAAPLIDQAIELLEKKGNRVEAGRAQMLREELRAV